MSAPGWEPPSAFDEYRIVRLLGHGAMGQVYLAHDGLLDRSVAIKFLGALEVGDRARERFFTEARAVARLSHPNVVAVHRAGEVRRRPYLVSEYVSGTSLDRIEKPLAWERILKIGIGLARGLASAHERGVLHRDIKPANVVIGDADQAKLLDFGLAKLLDAAAPARDEIAAFVPPTRSAATELAATVSMGGMASPPQPRGSADATAANADHAASPGEPPLTAVGAIVGTPLYLAPELWRSEPASRRTDIYALGVLLYELACGRAPHASAPAGELGSRAQAADAEPVSSCARGLPSGLAQLIDSCVSRDPARRPGSADALCERLEALAQRRWPESSGDAIEKPPFRRLAPFTEEDRGQLCGRDRELSVLAEQILFRRMVVFTGPSGTGKTSMLRAGLQPRLQERGIHVIYASSRTEPAAAIIAELAPGATTVTEAVAAWSATHSARLVIILDQVETLLGDRPPGATGEVLDDIVALGRDRASPRVSTVVSVREDFLARVLAYTQRPDEAGLPIIRLGPVGLDGARDAIVQPLAGRGLAIEPELLDKLLVDLADAAAALGRELGWGAEAAVYPPHLQLACSVLYEALARDESTLTIDHYRRLGGLEAIVGEHLDRVLETELTPEAAAIARDLFLALVTAAQTRAARTEAELLEAVSHPGSVARVGDVLEALRAHGLLVRTGRTTGEPTWELIHDSLVPRVQGWIDRHDLSRRRAIELVRHHLRRSTEAAPSLLSRAELRELHPHPEALRELDAEWARRTAASLGIDEAAWTPSALVARSRGAIRRRLALAAGLAAAVLAMICVAVVDRLSAAAAERREQSLRDRDLGRFLLELTPFDWDAGSMTDSTVAAADLPDLDWTLHEVDPYDPDSPGPRLDGSRLVRGAASLSAGGRIRVDRVEAPGGPAFLTIVGRGRRGETCPPSIVALRSLPGYARRAGEPARLAIRVPTCRATRAGMIVIPAGPFISGGVGEPPSPVQQSYGVGEFTLEQPRFAVDRAEVTNAGFGVFAAMAALTGISAPIYADTHELATAGAGNRPVAGISWTEARAFCRFMGRRLPTSSEWQKAARGGLTLNGRPNPHPRRNLPWGPVVSPVPANINRGADVGPARVGTFPGDVSPYGVLDLAGNVHEWTSTPDSAGLRITRGGNWADTTPALLVDYLAILNPRPAGTRIYQLGFRCAAD